MADLTHFPSAQRMRELEAKVSALEAENRELVEQRAMTRGLHELVRLQILEIAQICYRQRLQIDEVEGNIERLRQRLPE